MQLGGRACKPKNTLPLLTSTVKMDAEDPSMRCCFRSVVLCWEAMCSGHVAVAAALPMNLDGPCKAAKCNPDPQKHGQHKVHWKAYIHTVYVTSIHATCVQGGVS